MRRCGFIQLPCICTTLHVLALQVDVPVSWMACSVIVTLSTHEPSQVTKNVSEHMRGHAE